MANITKGGKAYDSGDVIVTMLGNSPNEVSEITYGTEQEHQVNHSLGNEATSWSMGKKNHSGSITLSMKECIAIEDAIPGDDKSLMRVKPFDIVVTYVSEYNKIVTDIVTAKFTGQGREVTGDMGLSKQLPLLVLNIRYNVV